MHQTALEILIYAVHYRYEEMLLLLASKDLLSVERLEKTLIAAHRGRQGCKNVASGGEGGLAKRKAQSHCFYTYVVATNVANVMGRRF